MKLHSEVSEAANPMKTMKKFGGRDRDRTGDPCLQSRRGKTLKALSGVAYTENWRNFRSLKCPEVVPNFSAPLIGRAQLRFIPLCPILCPARFDIAFNTESSDG
jgi:hypothetical protein